MISKIKENEIYCIDNLELLKKMKNNSVDLIYCDILYNTGRKFKDYDDRLGTPQQAMEWYRPRLIEMKRVLKDKGKAAIVIGNTQFKNVDILNAEIFCEQMINIGFKVFDIIHREIPSKMLPSTRDSVTGRFAKTSSTDKLVYPTEYILIMEKS